MLGFFLREATVEELRSQIFARKMDWDKMECIRAPGARLDRGLKMLSFLERARDTLLDPNPSNRSTFGYP